MVMKITPCASECTAKTAIKLSEESCVKTEISKGPKFLKRSFYLTSVTLSGYSYYIKRSIDEGHEKHRPFIHMPMHLHNQKHI